MFLSIFPTDPVLELKDIFFQLTPIQKKIVLEMPSIFSFCNTNLRAQPGRRIIKICSTSSDRRHISSHLCPADGCKPIDLLS